MQSSANVATFREPLVQVAWLGPLPLRDTAVTGRIRSRLAPIESSTCTELHIVRGCFETAISHSIGVAVKGGESSVLPVCKSFAQAENGQFYESWYLQQTSM
jgi:hypothetical protein